MIEIWGKPLCPYCTKAKQLCEDYGHEYIYKQLDEDTADVKYHVDVLNPRFTRDELLVEFPNARTFPQIKVDGTAIGGYDDLVKWHKDYMRLSGYWYE